MIIRRTNLNLVTEPINRWMTSYILSTKSRHYEKLLGIIIGACNDHTNVVETGYYMGESVSSIYDRVKTYKHPHSLEGTAIREVRADALLSYKNPAKIDYHIFTLTVQWQEGEAYIHSIDEKINRYLKKHCFLPTKLELPKEEK